MIQYSIVPGWWGGRQRSGRERLGLSEREKDKEREKERERERERERETRNHFPTLTRLVCMAPMRATRTKRNCSAPVHV